MKTTTIAGIATAPGNAGIGIVRLSGSRALEIVSKCFKYKLKPRVATLGIFNGTNFSDTVITLYFPAPHSFTGEDVIEIQAHGGSFLLQKVLEHLITLGAEPGQPGEFSKRAFLNGKLSLDQAEAIIETINAESESHLRSAASTLQGKLRDKLHAIQSTLTSIAANIEATLNYPEHDTESDTKERIKSQLVTTLTAISSLTDTFGQGRLIANGIQIAVLGKPNVGKSSLFNALLGRDRSIVTNIAGTTTDTVSASLLYMGVRLVFNDTAGLASQREIGLVEKIGMERTIKTVEDADIVLAIFDGSAPQEDGDREILELVKNKRAITILNKSDLKRHEDWRKAPAADITCSALTGQSVEAIKELIYRIATDGKPLASEAILITNARHVGLLTQAKASLENVVANIGVVPLDCIAGDVRDALQSIGNITGANADEAIIDQVFSRFCIGK